MNRAQRRAAQKSNKKKDKKSNKEIDNVMGMFDLLPDQCSACLTPYDKKDRKMVTTWNVIVKEENSHSTQKMRCMQTLKYACKTTA